MTRWAGHIYPTVLGVSLVLRLRQGQQRPPHSWGEGRILRQSAWVRAGGRVGKSARGQGLPEQDRRGAGRQQAPCHLAAAPLAPPQPCNVCLLADWVLGRLGWEGPGRRDRCVGGLGGQVVPSGPGGWMSGVSKADRRCHPTVTSGLARGHQEPGPPQGCTPTAAPIRFLPIKWPVFLLGKLHPQWSLGERHGGGNRALGQGSSVPANTAHTKLMRRAHQAA